MPEPSLFALPGSSRGSRAGAFVLSLGVHGAVVALLTTASQHGWLDVKPVHAQRALLREHKILWYTPTAELPPVEPLETPAEPAPDRDRRSDVIRPQRIEARSPSPESRRQMVLQAPPQLRLERDVLSANVLAWNPTAPVAPKPSFQLPEPKAPQPRTLAEEAEAPQVTAAAPRPAAPLAIEPARWSAPPFRMPAPEPRRPTAQPLVAEAPSVAAAAPGLIAPVAIEPAQLPRFQLSAGAPPPARPGELSTPAPQVATSATPVAAPLGIAPARLPERPRFEMPAGRNGGQPPPRRELAMAAPDVPAQPAPATVIVGLDPTPQPAPPPPGNRSAQFSAGPEAGSGSEAPVVVARAAVRVPNLSIAPAPGPTMTRPPLAGVNPAEFRRQLLAPLAASRALAASATTPADTTGVLQGSTVYSMAVDMPNITSYDGSWIVRFTEVGGSSPDDLLTAPVPLRKVDPKYNAAAAAEKVEGKVLLYAVIRRDGRVDQVRLVQGVDERLDTSAVEAFSKWQFQPGTKNGAPVDLEAVVQIPFRAGPRASR